MKLRSVTFNICKKHEKAFYKILGTSEQVQGNHGHPSNKLEFGYYPETKEIEIVMIEEIDPIIFFCFRKHVQETMIGKKMHASPP
jgi:hypothetical protein